MSLESSQTGMESWWQPCVTFKWADFCFYVHPGSCTDTCCYIEWRDDQKPVRSFISESSLKKRGATSYSLEEQKKVRTVMYTLHTFTFGRRLHTKWHTIIMEHHFEHLTVKGFALEVQKWIFGGSGTWTVDLLSSKPNTLTTKPPLPICMYVVMFSLNPNFV